MPLSSVDDPPHVGMGAPMTVYTLNTQDMSESQYNSFIECLRLAKRGTKFTDLTVKSFIDIRKDAKEKRFEADWISLLKTDEMGMP